MAATARSIIFLLAFALLIQNTCPHGYAGKSTVTSACAHCPLKHSLVAASPSVHTQLASDSSGIHFPMFVFSVPKTIHTFQLSPIETAQPVLIDRYKDALPDELLRPPQA